MCTAQKHNMKKLEFVKKLDILVFEKNRRHQERGIFYNYIILQEVIHMRVCIYIYIYIYNK